MNYVAISIVRKGDKILYTEVLAIGSKKKCAEGLNKEVEYHESLKNLYDLDKRETYIYISSVHNDLNIYLEIRDENNKLVKL